MCNLIFSGVMSMPHAKGLIVIVPTSGVRKRKIGCRSRLNLKWASGVE